MTTFEPTIGEIIEAIRGSELKVNEKQQEIISQIDSMYGTKYVKRILILMDGHCSFKIE